MPTVCQHGGVTTTETAPSSHDAGTSERSPVPLRIGALEVPTPVELAPMAGVTNASFRRLCREMAEAALPGRGGKSSRLTVGRDRLAPCSPLPE